MVEVFNWYSIYCYRLLLKSLILTARNSNVFCLVQVSFSMIFDVGASSICKSRGGSTPPVSTLSSRGSGPASSVMSRRRRCRGCWRSEGSSVKDICIVLWVWASSLQSQKQGCILSQQSFSSGEVSTSGIHPWGKVLRSRRFFQSTVFYRKFACDHSCLIITIRFPLALFMFESDKTRAAYNASIE